MIGMNSGREEEVKEGVGSEGGWGSEGGKGSEGGEGGEGGR